MMWLWLGGSLLILAGLAALIVALYFTDYSK